MLPEAIESVFSQSYSNFEVIIVDDGSNKETLSVYQAYEKDSRIRIIYQANMGPSVARNNGISIATGSYILPLDADDKIHPNYMEKALEAFSSDSNLGIVYCKAEFFGGASGLWELPEFKFPEILLGNRIFVTSFFKKKDWELVGGFDDSFKDEWEDFDFWLKILELGRKVKRIPEVLFYYRKGHESRTKKSGLELVDLFEKIYKNHQSLYSENIRYLFKEIIDYQILNASLNSEVNRLDVEVNRLEDEVFRLDEEVRKLNIELSRIRISFLFRLSYFFHNFYKVNFWKKIAGLILKKKI